MIQKDLFDLSEEQTKTSEMIYEGKIIKCLVAPFHTYEQLERMLDYTPTTFLFPERDVPLAMLPNFINMIVRNPDLQEAYIVTANQNIILDMVDSSVRVLTEDGEIVPCPIKTFMANIHDIRYNIFENKAFRTSEEKKNNAVTKINVLIERINNGEKTGLPSAEIEELKGKVDLIGEQIVRTKLHSMIHSIPVKEH